MGDVTKLSLEEQELALFLAGVKPAICLDEADPRASLDELSDYPMERFRGGSLIFFQDEGLRDWYVETLAEFERNDGDDRYVLGIVLGYHPGAVAYFTDPANMNPWTLGDRGFVNYYGMFFGFERSTEDEVCEWLETTYEIPEYLKQTGEYTVNYPYG